ncbi:hypothetical protein DMA11_00185 [Marinilabiliaceae bacterium JC017]|nr:hypothetical protein DMA11_00185 [Marinilabiliaceae bacterium JC017]
MEILRDKWRYIETDRNILKQPVLTIVNLKERSLIPIDEKSLRLSASAVYNESCLSYRHKQLKVTPLEEAFFQANA